MLLGTLGASLLGKLKDRAYVINLDEYKSIGIEYQNRRPSYNAIYFDSFGIEHIPKEI